MRHHINYGCAIVHIDLYGYACKNHNVWLSIDGFELKGHYKLRPSELEKK